MLTERGQVSKGTMEFSCSSLFARPSLGVEGFLAIFGSHGNRHGA